MIWFLDTSVLVKRYVVEADSAETREVFQDPRRRFAASALTSVEIRSALFRKVTEGLLDEGLARRAAAAVDADLAMMLVVAPRPRTLRSAGKLVERHRLRAYDAVQLACALVVHDHGRRPVTFGCADTDLRAAARAEGLRVFPGRSPEPRARRHRPRARRLRLRRRSPRAQPRPRASRGARATRHPMIGHHRRGRRGPHHGLDPGEVGWQVIAGRAMARQARGGA